MAYERKGRARDSFAWIAGLLLILFAVPVFAQLPTGTILGVVKDSSGAVVPGTTVTIANRDTGSSRTATTADDGSYRVPALPVGNYQVRAVHQGFKTADTGLTLAVSQEQVVNFSLEVGAATESVTVSAEVSQVNTTSSSLGGLVDEAKVADLPLNGRNFSDLSLLQTGVARLTGEGSAAGIAGTIYSSNGAPTTSNNTLLDGAPTQNLFGYNSSSVNGTALGVDGIREYKVITNLFSAEYGLTMGSQTTIVSKGGTNQWHGDIFEFIRNSTLDARNLFDSPAAGRRLSEFQRNQFGGSVGGPIRKDKTFFFATYEGVRENLDRSGLVAQTVTLPAACHPNASGTIVNPVGCYGNSLATNPTTVNALVQPLLALFPNPNTDVAGSNVYSFANLQRTGENYGQVRVDQNFSTSDTFFGRYTIDNTALTRPRTYLFYVDGLTSRNQFLTLSENHTFGTNLLNSVRTSYSRTKLLTTSTALTTPVVFVPGQQLGSVSISGGWTGYGPDTSPGYHKQDILTASDDLFWTKKDHGLKFGVLVNRYEMGLEEGINQRGSLAFASLANFMAAQPQTITAVATTSNMNRDFVYYTAGFYVQDDYRVLPRLTLNLGLRYEFNTVPREKSGKEYRFTSILTQATTTQGPVVQNYSLHNFSPRVGFAWDIFGHGATAVRGGAGIFYDIAGIGGALVHDTIGTPPLSVSNSITYTAPYTNSFNTPLFPPGVSAAVLNLDTLDYNATQPHMYQWNLSIEQRLPAGMTLTVGYVGSRGLHLWNSPNLNIRNPVVTNGIPYWAPPAPGPITDRKLPQFGTINFVTTNSSSHYNSLQVGLSKRLSRGLQFQSSYTWSRALDYGQGQLTNNDPSTVNMVSPYWFPRFDYGPTSFDVSQNWRFNMLYHIPDVKSQGFASKLVQGWWLGGIVALQTGYPFTPSVAFSQSNSQNSASSDRPDIVSSNNLAFAKAINPNAVVYDPNSVIVGTHFEWFNPNMFIPSSGPSGGQSCTTGTTAARLTCASGYLGNVSRGLLRGPRLADMDLSLNKNTKLRFLGESGALEFRAEFFNLLNRANYAVPASGTFLASGALGPTVLTSQITNTVTPNRQIQFGLKLIF